jgi:hypothetical protein
MRAGARVRGLLLTIAIATTVGLIVVVLYAAWTNGSLDPRSVPSRLVVDGRTYRAAEEGTDRTRAEIEARCPTRPCPAVLEPVIGAWPFVLPWDPPELPGELTPMRVYLGVGSDRYREYGLVGGP